MSYFMPSTSIKIGTQCVHVSDAMNTELEGEMKEVDCRMQLKI